MKKAKVVCVQAPSRGLDFYLRCDGVSYYLFNQHGQHQEEIQHYFQNGVDVSKAVSRPGKVKDYWVCKIIEKMPYYIHYVEREHDLVVLEKTARKKGVQCYANAL